MARLMEATDEDQETQRPSTRVPDVQRRMADELGHAPAPAHDQARIEESARRTTESLRDLTGMMESVNQVLQEAGINPSDPAAARARLRLEHQYQEAADGHERPRFIFRTPEEARRHSDDIFRYRHGTGSMGSPEASIAQQNQQLKAEVQRWLSTSYLGETIYHRFTQTPPNLTTETDHFFNTASPGAAALYYHDTNHILIRESELSVNRPMEVCHEVLHYASFLGGGMDVRWRNGRGATSDAPVIIGDQRWFIEGLTDLHAHQLARAHQHTPTGVGYATEAAVGFYIQSVVGKETLRHAYVTGDYTAVRLAFDRRLGEGAFEQVVRSRTGRIALNRITELFRSAHIDYHQWDSDPFLSACINCMPSDDLRGFWRRD